MADVSPALESASRSGAHPQTGPDMSPAGALLAGALDDPQRPCALFLDVDGSLLDIAEAPAAVVVPNALCATLQSLHERLHGALALVSGRPVADLDRLFAPLILPAAGGHGAHWRLRAGEALRRESCAPLPPQVRGQLLALAGAHAGVLAEDKGTSVALHYRVAPAARPALARALEALLGGPEGTGLRLLPGKMVFEIVREGCDKARAVRCFLGEAPFAGRRPVFVGDDVTDEPALALMPALGGLALSVGQLLPGAAAAFGSAQELRLVLARAAGIAP
jgi:trehalose 6-phosphate phosphatase